MHQASLKIVSFEGLPSAPVETELGLSNPNSCISQAKVVTINGGSQVLVIITDANVQFHDISGTCVLFTYLPESRTVDKKALCLPVAKGITGIGDTIVVGSSDGGLLVFTLSSSSLQVDFDKMLTAHNTAVSDVYADATRLASCDIDGNVYLWECSNEKKQISSIAMRFEGFNGFPATSVLLSGDLICAAYGSGHIRVFSASKRRMLCEIAGHGGWINALDIASQSQLILSVGDDTKARIWRLSEDQQCIKHMWSTRVRNTMLVGGCFLSDSGDEFAISGYDSCHALLFAARKCN